MNCIEVNIDITILEGGTFDKTYQWKTGDPAVAVDLTGYTGAMKIRSSLKSTTVLLSVPNGDGDWAADEDTGIYFYTQSGDDTGKYRIYLRDNDTLGLCADHKEILGVYDLFLYNADDEAVLKQYGVCTIPPAVTRT